MKKIIITTCFFLGSFLIMNTISASTPDKSKNAKESIRREITRSIICPDFVTENSPLNEVKAIVQVSEDGKVSIEEINSGNEHLRDYVLDQLQNMKVKNNAAITEKFVLVIKFTVE